MPNSRQRDQNRRTARELRRKIKFMNHICENCGEKGAHWIDIGDANILPFNSMTGKQGRFWTCNKLYGQDGRRLPGV